MRELVFPRLCTHPDKVEYVVQDLWALNVNSGSIFDWFKLYK